MAFSYDEPIRYNEGKVDWTLLPWDYKMIIEMVKVCLPLSNSNRFSLGDQMLPLLIEEDVFKLLCISLIINDKKYPTENPNHYFIPWDSLEQVCRVFAFGAEKYERDNFKIAPGLPLESYIQSMWRHLVEYLRGELVDNESQLPHLSHLACNCFMYLWTQKEYHTK